MVTRLALLVSFFFSLLSSTTVYGATSTSPAPIPMFHKSPYFNAWVQIDTSNASALKYPRFAINYGRELSWFIGIRVDNISYVIQGHDTNYTAATTVSTYITSTQTRFSIAAGPVLVNLTYLTPIELQDWALHSFPFAYAAFDIMSSDGNPHAIQLYTDTTAQFVSSSSLRTITWATTSTSRSTYHKASRTTLQRLEENDDMSEDGTQILAYTTTPGVSMTWQTCFSAISRGNFTLNGKLENTSDKDYRVMNVQWPVLAFALDLGYITNTSNSLVFGIGLLRDPVGSYHNALNTTEDLGPLWHLRWNDTDSAIDDFLMSYPSASARATKLDDSIQRNVSALASELNISTPTATKLVDLHILSLRQTVGSLEFTTRPSSGQPAGIDNVRVIMKDVGYSRRTNPVNILYASFSAFLFLNGTLAGKLLEPLLELQNKSNFAAPDIGNSWPVIHPPPTDQSQTAIDNCGAMLIMALAHARKSGDGTLLFKYYDLLRKWADYLVENTPQSRLYRSSDDLTTSTANLALKGIMGVYAMGKINNILEERGADAWRTSYYLEKANAYTQDWLTQALAPDHVMASYGSNSTWAMIYNLFAPRLLGTPIIPERVYETQALWYARRNASAGKFGLTFDSTQSLARAHWTLLSASSVFNATSSGGRDSLISMVHTRSFWESGVNPNPASYSPDDGLLQGGPASPAMGAVYSLLAIRLPDLNPITPSGKLQTNSSRPTTRAANVPVIVGATFGVVGGLLFVAVVVFFLRRHIRLKANFIDRPLDERRQSQSNITPFTDSGTKPVHSEKSLIMMSPPSGSTHQISDVVAAAAAAGGGGAESEDDTLRQEVEELRRAVIALGTQQQQPQVYQLDRLLSDEPPPMYPSRSEDNNHH